MAEKKPNPVSNVDKSDVDESKDQFPARVDDPGVPEPPPQEAVDKVDDPGGSHNKGYSADPLAHPKGKGKKPIPFAHSPKNKKDPKQSN